MRQSSWAAKPDPNGLEDLLKEDADEEGIGDDDSAHALRQLSVPKARAGRLRQIRGQFGFKLPAQQYLP